METIFTIESDGDRLVLKDADGTIVNEVRLSQYADNRSWALTELVGFA